MMHDEEHAREPTMNAAATFEDATDSSSLARPRSPGYGDDEYSFVLEVVHLLAEALDEDVMTMRPRLAEVIDPEILVRLQRSESPHEQTLTFTYRDCDVTVTNRGDVTIR